MSAAAALARFCGDDPGRSAAVLSLRGEPVSAGVRADAPRPAASVLKLLVVAAALDAAGAGVLDIGERLPVGALPEVEGPSVLGVLDAGHALSLRELCGLALATSDNPAAEAVLERVGRERVDDLIARLGLTATRLAAGYDQRGIDDGRASVTTAADSIRMARELIAGRPAVEAMLESGVRNTRIPLRLPWGTRSPHKPGSLLGVANDVGVVYGERTDLAVAFLCEGQADTALTSIAIGDCVADLRRAVDEPVDERRPVPAAG